MANQFLALAMFIMLLSFFIILNAMSDYEEERSRPIMSSIAAVFSAKAVDKEDFGTTTRETQEQSYKQGDALDQVKGLFTAEVAGVKAQKNRLGTSMNLKMKLDDFERAIMTPKSSDIELLPTLVSLIDTQDNIPYRMDIVVGTGQNPAKIANENPDEARNYIHRASALADVLENAGLPRKLVSTGLGSGSAGYVDLNFQRYEPFNPVGVRGGG